MNTRLFIAPTLLVAALATSGCARNYAAEGAVAGAALGAGVSAVTGEDLAASAAIGAAAGAAAGYFVDKNDDCDGWRDRRWDDDCRGRDGYPD